MKNKIFLIDGHALIFKMYYAFLGRPMINGKGQDTSVLFGTAKYILELVAREHPTHLAIAFDPPGGTFRNRMFPEYKANRAETPQLVIDALEPLIAMSRAMRIPVLMVPDFEADDVIGSAVKKYASKDSELFMVTPDKDYGQLVCEGVFQYRPGKSDTAEILGPAEVCAKWNISSTSQVIDVLALCGDSADNVPGVQGVGPVGAAKLLAKYGNIDGIYSHIGELTARQQAMFEAARDHIGLSRELVTIRTDVVVDYSIEDLELRGFNNSDIREWLTGYEMPSLLRLLSKLCAETFDEGHCAEQEHSVSKPRFEYREAGFSELEDAARSAGRVTVLRDGDELCLAASGVVCRSSVQNSLRLLADPALAKCGEDFKTLYKSLSLIGVKMKGLLYDINIMHYVLNPEGSHSAESLSLDCLGVEMSQGEAVQGDLFDMSVPDAPDMLRRAAVLSGICSSLLYRMDSTARSLYESMEAPLIYVLADMEMTGVKVDMQALRQYADGLRSRMLEKERFVRDLAGDPALNVSSPKQIGELLFGKLGLGKGVKKNKNGSYPTDEQTLTEIAGESPIVDAILDYRTLRKLLGTYIDPFPGYVSPVDGRVHTTFNQSLTATGRLSSSNPNLQNIPVRSEQGREIRKAFVPGSADCVMMSADYSQIELRLMAHLCGDDHMIGAFRSGEDVHVATAAKVFHKTPSEVTSDDRRAAKAVNFGIMYGMSAFGLSQRLKCSRSEAKAIIEDYFASFPSIRGFIDSTLASAREKGYVETMFGRRRYTPGLSSNNANVRAMAERNAVNAPIQGSAADIIKLAMIAVEEAIAAESLRSRIVLQIHDELLLEVPRDEIEKVSALLRDKMEGVIQLSVPLTVECKYGENWLEAH